MMVRYGWRYFQNVTPGIQTAAIVNEITLVGSRCGRFEPALELLKNNKIHLDQMISERPDAGFYRPAIAAQPAFS